MQAMANAAAYAAAMAASQGQQAQNMQQGYPPVPGMMHSMEYQAAYQAAYQVHTLPRLNICAHAAVQPELARTINTEVKEARNLLPLGAEL